MNQKEYYLGLDLGTSSVGWAVTDKSYKLMRAKGKDLWGIRLFEEAETAAGRRTNRVARRRRQRETARIGLLKEYFADAIAEVDSSFYERLEESKYHIEDKKVKGRFSVFADKKYTDKDYYKEYPTIYHLRMELINNNKPHDVRLIYLALLNMFKHRGHFLNAGLKAEENGSGMQDAYNAFVEIADEYRLELIKDLQISQLEEILSKREISKSKMAEEIAELFHINRSKNKREYEVVKGLCGLTVSVNTLLDISEFDENHKKIQLSFRDAGYDEKIAELSQLTDERDVELIEQMQRLHDIGLLANVMKGRKYLSEARVKEYEKHKEDLVLLKRIIRQYVPEAYDDMFRMMEQGSYSAYVNSVNANVKARRNVKGRSQEDLYKKIKAILKDVDDCGEKEYILDEIDKETFLPKQLTASNGVIPNQVHTIEMKKILSNAEGYLPFLKMKDESGLTVSERIMELFQFQIPYYVGPLNLQHVGCKNGHAWAVRKKRGRVLPWNIQEMVDLKQTSENFISNMVRRCTYIHGEQAIPKDALLYQRYCVLNELNNLRIRGEKPSVELKQRIYQDLFLKGKRVTQNQLQKYLIACGQLEVGETDAISGIDKDFQNSLSSYGRFIGVFGDAMLLDSTKEMVEDIIFWGTIYGNDKKLFIERIRENYDESKITEEQLKRIGGFKFHDWGRLSKQFLELLGCEKCTGEVLPLITMLWERNENLMELLSERYTYIDELQKYVKESEKILSEMKYEDLDDLYFSSPVKRMVWQTILILQELEDVLGCAPARIFVEMPREDGEKGKRTDSRQKRLIDLYKSCRDDSRNWVKELQDLSDQKLRSKKLYLYYLQQGRCMYTGEPIDLDELFNDNLYDIDHIYPRHFVKDDSLENNLVLVKKEKNAHKSDNYPIEESIYKARCQWWKSLLTKDMQSNFITREKYNRLVCRDKFSDEQLAGFIARQIVETRQGTKAVAHLFENMFPESEVVYVKAGNVSAFRQERDLLKCRSVNDFHHAQDAYLNIVVGNTYFVKFTKNPANFIRDYRKDAEKNAYHICKMFNSTVTRNGEVAWLVGNKNGNAGTIETVRKMMAKNSPLITRMNFEAHGQISDATLYGAETAKPDAYMPLKSSDSRMQDVTKYGGFGKIKGTYFFLVEHEKKGRKIRTLESIPLYISDKIGCNKKLLEQYCREELKLIKPDVRMMRIKVQSLVRYDGYLLYISGRSGKRLTVRNAVSLCVEQTWVSYVKKLEKTVVGGYVDDTVTSEKNQQLYNVLLEKHLETIYAKRPNPVGNKLLDGREQFNTLSELEQAKVLMQILQLTQLANLGADLRLIGDVKGAGEMKIGKTVSDAEEFVLINQSPTGLYESEIDLMAI